VSAASEAVCEHLREAFYGPASVIFIIPARYQGHLSRALAWLGLCAWPSYETVERN